MQIVPLPSHTQITHRAIGLLFIQLHDMKFLPIPKERVESIESQVPDTQPSPEVVTAQELRKPAGGTEAELGLEQPDKRDFLTKALGFGGDLIKENLKNTRKILSSIGYLGTTPLPFTDKTPFELFRNAQRVQAAPFQIDALNDLGKDLRKKGVTASDLFSTRVSTDKTKDQQQKVLDSFPLDLGDYGQVNDALEFGLNTIGVSTVDDRGILSDIIKAPSFAFNQIPSVAKTNQKLFLEAAIKGDPVPENFN